MADKNIDYVGQRHTIVAQDENKPDNGGSSVVVDTNAISLNCLSAADNAGISIDSNGAVVISSEESITLKVGNSQLVIKPKEITISVQQFKNTKFGFWDSTISLNTMTGATISSGNKVTLNGFTGNTMSDGFGGLIRTSVGNATVKGATATIGCPNLVDQIATDISLGAKIAQLGVETGYAGETDANKKEIDKYKAKIPAIINSLAKDITLIINEGIKPTSTEEYSSFITGCSVVSTAADIAYQIAELAAYSAYIGSNNTDSKSCYGKSIENAEVSGHDILAMALQCINIGALILGVAPAYLYCHASCSGNSTLRMNTQKIGFKTSKLNADSVVNIGNKTISAI